MFFGNFPFPPFLQYSVADRNGNMAPTTVIDLPLPVFIHDLAITRRYRPLLAIPGVLHVRRVLTGKPLFRCNSKTGTRIGVLPRDTLGHETKWFDIKPCFVFHVLNAFEVGDEVHLYVCHFPENPSWLDLNKRTSRKEVVARFEASSPSGLSTAH